MIDLACSVGTVQARRQPHGKETSLVGPLLLVPGVTHTLGASSRLTSHAGCATRHGSRGFRRTLCVHPRASTEIVLLGTTGEQPPHTDGSLRKTLHCLALLSPRLPGGFERLLADPGTGPYHRLGETLPKSGSILAQTGGDGLGASADPSIFLPERATWVAHPGY